MEIHPLVRPLATLGAILGIVQGLAWIVLCSLGLALQDELWVPNFEAVSSYNELLNFVIYSLYIKGNGTTETFGTTNRIVTPDSMFYWLVVYLVFSIIWFLVSSCQMWVVVREKYKSMKNVLGGWVLFTAIICILDVILLGLLSHDYHVVSEDLNENFTADINSITLAGYILVAVGIMLTLSARGYVLWIVNFVLLCVLAFFAFKISDEEEDDRSDTAPIDAYQHTSSNPFWARAEDKRKENWGTGISNSAYNWQPDRPAITRSYSFYAPKDGTPEEQPNRMSRNRSFPNITQDELDMRYSYDKSASNVGKPPIPAKPLNSIPPSTLPPLTRIEPKKLPYRVPSPDYTPPNSPLPQKPLKPALRTIKPLNDSVYW